VRVLLKKVSLSTTCDNLKAAIGSVEDVEKKITLYENIYLRLLPKMSLNEYKDLLPEIDIGLSLMLSSHSNRKIKNLFVR